MKVGAALTGENDNDYLSNAKGYRLIVSNNGHITRNEQAVRSNRIIGSISIKGL
jgi:hypothetical protein